MAMEGRTGSVVSFLFLATATASSTLPAAQASSAKQANPAYETARARHSHEPKTKGQAIDLDSFRREMSALFPRTPRARALGAESRAQEAEYQAAIRESPFTLSSSVQRKYFQHASGDIIGLNGLIEPSNEWLLNNTLSYQNRFGIQGNLYADYWPSEIQPPSPIGASDHPYAVGVSFGFDLLRGGANGLGKSEERAAAQAAQQSRYTEDSSLITARLQFEALVVDVYVVSCKIQRVLSAQSEIAETVKVGQLQVQTGTLAYKDFLNYLDLKNSFSRRLIEQQGLADGLGLQAGAWSPEVSEKLKELAADGLDCEASPERIEGQVKDAGIPDDDLHKIAEVMPTTLSANAAREAAEARLRVAKLGNRPSLVPSVGVDYIRQPETFRGFADAYGQVLLQWNIPGAHGDYSVSAADLEQAAAGEESRNSIMENYSRLAGLETTIATQRSMLHAFAASAETLAKLRRTLEAQKAIGGSDALNYATSYLNEIDARNGLIDAWGAIEKSVFELDQYREWKRSYLASRGLGGSSLLR